MKRRCKEEAGSITIEATISLTAFMFVIVTILTILNICIVQARMAYAINATAKEISQYSYLYSLTGLNDSQEKLEDTGEEDTKNVKEIGEKISESYKAIKAIGKSEDDDSESSFDFSDFSNGWNELSEKLKKNDETVKKDIKAIMSNPTQVIFGFLKLGASEAWDYGKSKLIMEPLAWIMCKKHLKPTEDGDVEAYLKSLGVVPDGEGHYYNNLNFEDSTLFPNGSNTIKVCVSYDVKVIALLPIDFTFHFEQTAVTHGWLAGEDSDKKESEKKKKYAENKTLWTEATATERADYIRHLAFNDLKSEGYAVLAYPYNSDGILYSSSDKEFVMPRSWNPLSGQEDGEVDKLNEKEMQEYIEYLCGTIKSNNFGSTVTVKQEKSDGSTEKTDVSCEGATYRIILTIPEDKGLKEKMEAVIAKSNTRGVTIEFNQNFGNGAKKTEVTTEDKKDEATKEEATPTETPKGGTEE